MLDHNSLFPKSILASVAPLKTAAGPEKTCDLPWARLW